MAYRTKKEPGNDAKGNLLLGLKITGEAEKAINSYEKDGWKIIDKIRGGLKAGGTYTVNGKKCSHNKAGSKKYAVAWWSDDKYVYVEALIEHTGQGNDYAVVK
jgi:hypothetical protein